LLAEMQEAWNGTGEEIETIRAIRIQTALTFIIDLYIDAFLVCVEPE